MLLPFFGEFLIHPAPLELSLNYCTHKCAYCFANLNKPDRRADVDSVMRLLSEHQSRKSLGAQLLQRKYPVVMSNKVDPFAASNHKLAVPIMRLLTQMEIPVALQTKGGRGIEEALEFLKPSAWYVSISFQDDEKRKAIEPGAPSIESRFALCEQLVKAGHHVKVGLNPLVREWCPAPSEMFARLREIGVTGVWTEVLHLNRDQHAAMSGRERAAMTPEILARAMRRKVGDDDYNFFVEAIESARAAGLHIACVDSPYDTGYFESYHAAYPGKCFPTMPEFVTWCYANKQPGDKIYFRDFWNFCEPRLPLDMTASLRDYACAGATRTIAKTNIIPRDITWKGVMSVIWQDARAKCSPAKNHAFAPHEIEEGENMVQFICRDYDLPIYIFTGNTLRKRGESS